MFNYYPLIIRGFSFKSVGRTSKLSPPAIAEKPRTILMGMGYLATAITGALIVRARAVTLHTPNDVVRTRVSKSSLIMV